MFFIKPCTSNGVTISGHVFLNQQASRTAIKDADVARFLNHTNKFFFKHETVRTPGFGDRNKVSLAGGEHINSVSIPEQVGLSVRTPHFMRYQRFEVPSGYCRLPRKIDNTHSCYFSSRCCVRVQKFWQRKVKGSRAPRPHGLRRISSVSGAGKEAPRPKVEDAFSLSAINDSRVDRGNGILPRLTSPAWPRTRQDTEKARCELRCGLSSRSPYCSRAIVSNVWASAQIWNAPPEKMPCALENPMMSWVPLGITPNTISWAVFPEGRSVALQCGRYVFSRKLSTVSVLSGRLLGIVRR